MHGIWATQPATTAATLAPGFTLSFPLGQPQGLLAQQQGQGGGPSLMFPMIAIMVLAYFLLLRPQQQKERRYREMIESLKEHDQVVTTGGIHGVVTNVHRDAERVTLRIDDATGVKIRVGLWAISQVVGDDNKSASDKKKPEAKSNK